MPTSSGMPGGELLFIRAGRNLERNSHDRGPDLAVDRPQSLDLERLTDAIACEVFKSRIDQQLVSARHPRALRDKFPTPLLVAHRHRASQLSTFGVGDQHGP